MIEVPSAANHGRGFCKRGRLLQPRTNDLIQYALAHRPDEPNARCPRVAHSIPDHSPHRHGRSSGARRCHSRSHLRSHGVRPSCGHPSRRPWLARAVDGGCCHSRDQRSSTQVTVAECEAAAQAALASDSAEAVEGLRRPFVRPTPLRPLDGTATSRPCGFQTKNLRQ